MKKFTLSIIVIVAGAMAFGMPEVPDVPGVEVPDFEIPGMSILDDIQLQLDELVTATDSLKWLIPELAALEDVSAKLEEMRETDPDVIGLQEELDQLRAELEAARGEIEAVTSVITDDVEQMRSSLDAFTEGLPGRSE
ncbi:MAG: hypothetical protein R6U39_05365 [Candidatus Aegiribacteria sp.]